jgi:hypothetical protein
MIIYTHFGPRRSASFTLNASQIAITLKHVINTLHFHRQDISTELISSHSLLAGGTTALCINGLDVKTIQILGRWSSDSFLAYIHHQIIAFSLGLLRPKAANAPFHNTTHPYPPLHWRPSAPVAACSTFWCLFPH